MKKIIVLTVVILIVLITGVVFLRLFRPGINSNDECKNICLKLNWQDGKCEWDELMNEVDFNVKLGDRNISFPYSEVENKGSCVESFLGAKSMHCGNEGQCNCYCINLK